ncbi:MAG TPA: hypothetical protein VNO32_13280 [Candidatus Acidoferrum sp.]|nr:hypothetical protein [Candidatus Acidoferrum sp.]
MTRFNRQIQDSGDIALIDHLQIPDHLVLEISAQKFTAVDKGPVIFFYLIQAFPVVGIDFSLAHR